MRGALVEMVAARVEPAELRGDVDEIARSVAADAQAAALGQRLPRAGRSAGGATVMRAGVAAVSDRWATPRDTSDRECENPFGRRYRAPEPGIFVVFAGRPPLRVPFPLARNRSGLSDNEEDRALMSDRRMLFSALGVVLLAGCSRSYSTAVDPQTGRQRIYAMEQTEALALAHGAIVRSFPGRRIETIDGPVRGYSTYTRMMLDTFTQQIVVRPVTGRTAQGQAVNGYTFEISGSGTSGSGAWRNDAFFEALQRDLAASGRGVDVTTMAPRIEAAAPAASSQPAAPDPIDQLRRLRELRDQGTISAPEYDRARAELLRRI